MGKYEEATAKLTNTQLNKLKTEKKNKNGITFRISMKNCHRIKNCHMK